MRAGDSPDDDRLFAELAAVVRASGDVADAADAPSLTLRPGLHLGPYELIEELRQGGQGEVWRARADGSNTNDGRQVALKVLRAGHGGERRFEREIEVAARLRHEHLVPLFESGLTSGRPWFAMELVDGRPLDEHLAATRLPQRARLELFVKIARAVGHAHRHGVLHRDLKPANVLVDARGEPKVLDFGVAALAGPRETRTTRTGEFVGTLAYAAPEQLRGDPHAVDLRADVYALGVLLYEMLAGHRPHGDESGMAELVRRIVDEPPRPPPAGTVDDELAAILATALAKEPERRYASADLFADDVARRLAGAPVAAKGLHLGYVLRKAIARRRGLFASVAVVVVVGGVALGVAARAAWREAQTRRAAAEVRAVLLDLLQAAAPDNSKSPTSPTRMSGGVPLAAVLDEAARHLDGALDDAPDAQAEIELALGDTWRRLLKPDEALPHLRAARARLEEQTGDSLATARCLQSLALTLAMQQQDEAIAVAEKALSIRRRELGDADPLVAQSESALGIALAESHGARDAAAAERWQRQALAGLEQVNRNDSEVARVLSRLAPLIAERGDPAQAESCWRRALAITQQSGDDALGLDVRHGFSVFLRRHGALDEAEELLTASVELARRLYGDEQAVEALRSFARLHFDRGDLATAERLSREALAQELSRWIDGHPSHAARLAELAHALRSLPLEVEAPLLASFAELKELRGIGAYELAGWSIGISLLERRLGRPELARHLLEGALEIRCRLFGDDCPFHKRALELLAELPEVKDLGNEGPDERRGG